MLSKIYQRLILDHPWLALLGALLVTGFFAAHIPEFKLDASADSLVLENDQALRYYRQEVSRYSSNDYLVLTYAPRRPLFSDGPLKTLAEIDHDLKVLPGVESVFSILNAPLLFSPPVPISDLKGHIRTLLDADTNREAAHKEFLTNPLYSKQLLSPDSKTTAILINLPINRKLRALLKQRTALRQKKFDNTISNQELIELRRVEKSYRRVATLQTKRQDKTVSEIRGVIAKYQNRAQMYLGGVPMIIDDMISYVRNDIIVFGVGVLVFLVLTMSIIFRRLRWVIIPIICCLTAALTMIGALGLLDWRVTVISSNFISLMLIFTMSLTIHLIVQYRELCAARPEADQRELLATTVRHKFLPCLYATLTTIAAFASLLVSSIRPVMDFGLMMTVGLVVSFIFSFIIFPASVMLLPRERIAKTVDSTPPLTMHFAAFTEKHGRLIVTVAVILTILSAMGIKRLVVENRFIDYFRKSTEIYKGMKLIDQKLGGTTPLDLIIDFRKQPAAAKTKAAPETSNEDMLLNDFGAPTSAAETAAAKYAAWFTSYKLGKIAKINNYLETLPQIGKVQSIDTLIKIATRLNGGISLDNYELSILFQKLPARIKKLLVKPYVSVPDNEARITMRIVESNKNMSMSNLLKKIHHFLVSDMKFKPDQIHFTNMLVLYNNMLQSLFRSQILTIGAVFVCILIMFIILFRSLSLAIIALLPNMLPAAMVLGLMGWINLPLDLMTITIASITIGIAVDDTIHYILRFKAEFTKDQDYIATMERCHGSIGKAMYYTSLTIVIGFSILVFSNFIPTIYFGLFTGFAMIAALLAALTLLPQIILMWKPFKVETIKK
ncbi:efflux RND transporter permease subunit [Desulfobacterota bacterium M19]